MRGHREGFVQEGMTEMTESLMGSILKDVKMNKMEVWMKNLQWNGQRTTFDNK